MARRVFFSFHYERDIWRANVVRNSWVTQDREAAGFWDAGLWERAKRRGDEDLIRRMINEGLANTSVTAVLIGAETSSRKWVRYEIVKSHERGNGLLAVYIHGIKDQYENTDEKGKNQFGVIYKRNGADVYFWQIYPTYDWIQDGGYKNFRTWVERAATAD